MERRLFTPIWTGHFSMKSPLRSRIRCRRCGLRKRSIPVVFCSSKTRAEIEHLRKATEVTDPFIIENGGIPVEAVHGRIAPLFVSANVES
jgi:ribosomal protein L37E